MCGDISTQVSPQRTLGSRSACKLHALERLGDMDASLRWHDVSGESSRKDRPSRDSSLLSAAASSYASRPSSPSHERWPRRYADAPQHRPVASVRSACRIANPCRSDAARRVLQGRGNANVKRSERLVRHDVNPARLHFVTPAKAGVHVKPALNPESWMPAFTGMTAQSRPTIASASAKR